MTSIASTLGIGSGVDTTALIESLATATTKPKQTAIDTRETQNKAKISALATISSSVTTFAGALNSLISGGTLRSQPSVSDSSILTATTKSGARITDLSAQIEVTQLATAQSLVSGYVATAATTPVGQGSMTLTSGTGSYTITIDGSNDSLTGLVSAINKAGAGITASIITDSNGSRLALKGATGAANSFTLTPASDAAAGLSSFAYDGTTSSSNGMTKAQSAQDAKIKLDGIAVSRSSNSIDDLIPGITVDLKSARVGSTVSLGVTRPTDAITQGVSDFVESYNLLAASLKEQTAVATSTSAAGALNGESAMRDISRQLAKLTSTVINTSGDPSTLAEIGVKTNRDGTLAVDSAKLSAMLASDPVGVEALFNPTQHSSSPLVTIVSPMGRVAPGTYTLTDLTAQTGSASASGTIGGVAALTTGSTLIAATKSKAGGLTIGVLGNVASATVTVDQGLAGALQAISDLLLGTSGAVTLTTTRLQSEATQIATDQTTVTDQDTAYRARLTSQFSTMDTRVAAYKSTQSFLDQQVKVWTNSNN